MLGDTSADEATPIVALQSAIEVHFQVVAQFLLLVMRAEMDKVGNAFLRFLALRLPRPMKRVCVANI